MFILSGVLLLLLLLALYIIYNLYNKTEYLTTYLDNIVESIDIMRNRVLEMNNQVRAIDRRGTFESDDEVGFFFKDMNEILARLNVLFAIVNDTPLEMEDDTSQQNNIKRY